ncbi:hypothetical protein BKP35_14920 [Anaerobacillus arseniciselenatis]|uniref:CAP domain-containing protein n=1 Tax=Anaerobacillus arseniciselenatis TaxID=85682 RepID=A0A1S2LDG5_9BACI|nr:CAP domain-containing protein [Anaerobacillus arseniciselenatis]OIJ09777.1 hypothetical protein BKP35_14920 [Anaerobacillus arseniciselenatis]
MGKIYLFIIVFFTSIAIYFSFFVDSKLVVEKDVEQIDKSLAVMESETFSIRNNNRNKLTDDGLHSYIGQPITYLEKNLGEPVRIDKSAYDYDWWIYSDHLENGYLQVGVEDEKVVSVYVIGDENVSTAPFQLGAPYDKLNENFNFEDQVSFNVRSNSYQFNLTEEELKTRPLLYIDNIFVQLYFDTFTNQLSSIRYLDHETIVKHRPYSVVYRGELIEAQPLSENEWREIEVGSSLQIYYITNQIRKKHSLETLSWDEETAHVAYLHSEDMKINSYFSHTSPANGELKDRLKRQEILYKLAGENIAAKYVDAIEAVEGWLNSEGHRVNLLHEEFTHLGVGVYQRYYTQNFITPW